MRKNVGDVQGPVGTQLVLTATSNKALLSAKLHRKGGEPVDMTIGEDGRSVSGEFTIHEAGTWSWWLALRDKQDFGNPDAPRYEIRGTPDAKPDVHFEEPVSDLLVTPTAKVEFKVVAKDDLALQNVKLVYEAQIGLDAVPELPTSGNEPPLELIKKDETWSRAASRSAACGGSR